MPTSSTILDARLATMASALGHPARIAILRTLARRSCICGEIVEELPLAQSTVSQHLKVLKTAGWITGVIDGPRTCYSLNLEAVSDFRFVLDPALDQWEGGSKGPSTCSAGSSCP